MSTEQEGSDVDAPRPAHSQGADPREQTSARLLALLEHASEASDLLDAKITEALYGTPSGALAGLMALGVARTPHYTGSIDAALTLVPEGMWWEVGRVCADYSALRHFGGGNTHSAKVDRWGGFGRPSYASTPALALCIAALRARQAKP